MSKRDNALLLEDMLEASSKILRYCDGLNYDEFLKDEKTIDAVVRNFEIIGEAASRVNPDFKSSCSDIEWDKLRGFRNRLIHEYFGVDTEILWEIIESELEDLILVLRELL